MVTLGSITTHTMAGLMYVSSEVSWSAGESARGEGGFLVVSANSQM